MKIGIYGGSFNPPHLGHIRGAAFAREALGLDRLLLIPVGDPPHKSLPAGSPEPEQRLAMARLAVGETPGLEVSDLEISRQGKSYTYETVEALHNLYPQAELTLLMGTDMYLNFSGWRQPQRIAGLCRLAVLHRGEKGERQRLEQCRKDTGFDAVFLENPVTAISSTDLRRMLCLGCGAGFLHPAVLSYIRENRLYGTGEDYRHLPEKELEQVVVSLLKPNRVAHVLGCRDTAVALAKRYGANQTDAARAALLHDITKALDGPVQLTLCREYGMILDDFSGQNPKTLHALTGSAAAKRIFGENEAVVSAIRTHTTGKADMNLLQKIIYVADYMEPNRDFPGVERLRSLAFTNITKALRLGLEMTLDMLRQQGRAISPDSAQALRYLDETGITCQ